MLPTFLISVAYLLTSRNNFVSLTQTAIGLWPQLTAEEVHT